MPHSKSRGEGSWQKGRKQQKTPSKSKPTSTVNGFYQQITCCFLTRETPRELTKRLRFLIETSGGAFGTSTWRKNPCDSFERKAGRLGWPERLCGERCLFFANYGHSMPLLCGLKKTLHTDTRFTSYGSLTPRPSSSLHVEAIWSAPARRRRRRCGRSPSRAERPLGRRVAWQKTGERKRYCKRIIRWLYALKRPKKIEMDLFGFVWKRWFSGRL